ncbi:MAG TPA: hypothetical protein PKK59_06555 [Anaerolineaceae bacterium]|nr:hypothetical protein [Anaerolineaceae bacterium]
MGDLLVSAIVIVVTAVIVAAIFIITGKKKKEKEAAITQLAQRNGWTYERVNQPQLAGFILRASDWTLESLVSSDPRTSEAGSSPVAYNNRWYTDRVSSAQGLVMIGPKLPQVQLGAFGDVVLQKALRVMLGDEADQAAGLAEVKVGRGSLAERYSVWSVSQEAAERALTYEVENALLRWKGKELPVLKFSSAGTQITTRQARLDSVEKIQDVVELGSAVLAG